MPDKTKNMNLNELLKQKASKKLDADIETYLKSIRENKLFDGINDKNIRLEDNKVETVHYFFWNNATAAKFIKEKFIDEYEAREAESFMQKVDGLQNELEELKNQ